EQYRLDQEVRFKQVELQNKLLDLFIDVPVALRVHAGAERKRYPATFIREIIHQQIDQKNFGIVEREKGLGDSGNPKTIYYEEPEPIGAATLLVNPQIQEFLSTIVLEGAPGQGKSTLAQYLCQVHRMKI